MWWYLNGMRMKEALLFYSDLISFSPSHTKWFDREKFSLRLIFDGFVEGIKSHKISEWETFSMIALLTYPPPPFPWLKCHGSLSFLVSLYSMLCSWMFEWMLTRKQVLSKTDSKDRFFYVISFRYPYSLLIWSMTLSSCPIATHFLRLFSLVKIRSSWKYSTL